MTRTRKAVAHVTFWVEPDLLARIDALVHRSSSPWQRVTRSDVVRGLIMAALPGLEKAVKASRKRARNERSRVGTRLVR